MSAVTLTIVLQTATIVFLAVAVILLSRRH